MTSIVELKKKNEVDLKKLLADHRSRLQEFRFKLKANQLKNVREVRVLKKDIARIQTLLQAMK